ncbi:MAG: hypothetical protein ACI92G_000238 [Candidatus Pelagisphaera sp.]|jgi:hypothetical protein
MNEENETPFEWKSSFEESFQEALHRFAEYAPHIIGAVLLLIVGWLIAYLLKAASNKLIRGLNSLIIRIPKLKNANRLSIRSSYAKIIGELIYWTVLALFFAASANLLGWTLVTEWLDGIVAFLPNLISGLFIVFIGIFVGNFAKSAVSTAVTNHGAGRATGLGRVSKAIIIFSFAVIGIEQIGVDLHFLTEVFVVTLGILLAGASLAFGLGARTLVANIIGVQRIRRHCSVGERIRVGDVEGEILELTQTSIILDTQEGQTIVPAKIFQEMPSGILSGDETDSEKTEGSSNV